MAEETPTLFARLYKGTKEAFDAIKMPLIERQLKRKIQEAVDSAKNQKLDAEIGVQKLQENIQSYDLNKFLGYKATITSADATIKALSDHYKELFGEDIS